MIIHDTHQPTQEESNAYECGGGGVDICRVPKGVDIGPRPTNIFHIPML